MGGLLFNFISALTAWFVLALPGIVVRVMSVLGFGYVSFSGFSVITAELGTFVQSQLSGFPSAMLQIMNLAGFGTGVNVLLSAVAAYFALKVAIGFFSMFTATGSFRA
jgi:hypothetical protein